MKNGFPYTSNGLILFTALRDVLAELYLGENDARIVVADAGLDAKQIAFNSRAQTNWHNILAEAIRQQRLDSLLKIALVDYAANPTLLAVYSQYRLLIDQGSDLEAPEQLPANVGVMIGGDINLDKGDFVARDKINHAVTNDASISIAIATDGSTLSDSTITIDNISTTIYAQITPKPLDVTALNAALATFDALPLDTIPPIASLPFGSHMPFHFNPLFVGREAELMQLAAALKAGRTTAIGQIAAATGLGGIGKSQLAVAFVHHYGQFFVGGVYWFSFANADTVATQFAACGKTMPELRADFATLDLESQVRLTRSAFQSPLPRLLIFDNCEEPDLLAHWRPTSGGSHVLLTSRRRNWEDSLGVQSLPLATLPRSQSIELLRKFRSDLVAHDPYLAQIANYLGDLPLALHLAGNYLKRYQYEITLINYLHQLQQPDLLQHRSLQSGEFSPTAHEQHVARTFALSYDRLNPAHPTDSLALMLLTHAACFAPGQLIPRFLLMTTIDLEEERRLQAADALEQLANLGLIEIDRVGNLLLHRLLVYFVQRVEPITAQSAQQVVAGALLEEANRINNAGIPGPLWVWQNHLRHITYTLANQVDQQSAELCNTLGFHLSMIGDYVGAHPYYERALAIREKTLGAKHPDTALSLNNLGYLLQARGDYAGALSHYERALAINEEILGTQHSNTALSLNNLGALLDSMGDYTAARSYYERALAIREEVLGKKHPDTASSLNNLGYLLSAQGNYVGALPYYEQALAIRKEVLGEKHPDTASSLNNLGYLLSAQGNYTDARSYYERALAIKEEILGAKHPDTALSLNNLGNLLIVQGNYTAARPYFERTLALREELLGTKHPDTAFSLNNLGNLLQAQGDYVDAKPYYERALAINEEILGEKHPATALSLNNLGNLLQAQGDYVGAKPYYERALAIREEILGEKHPDTVLSLNNLGTLLQAQGDYVGAKPYYERALAIREEILGASHPSTALSLNNLGYLLQAQGDYTAARPYFEQALAIREEILGEKHPDTALSLNNLGYLLRMEGDYSGARPYYERALAINEEILGANHPATARSLNNLGGLLRVQGDHVGARLYYERAFAIFKERLGASHPYTQTVRNNLVMLD